MVRAIARPLCEFDVFDADGSRETFAAVRCPACESVVAVVAHAKGDACGTCATPLMLVTSQARVDVELETQDAARAFQREDRGCNIALHAFSMLGTEKAR